MKIIITGASGFIGRQLVPLLNDMGHQMLLVGRDAKVLERDFPQHNASTYSQLGQNAEGYDILLHLAVANNNSSLLEADIFDVNVKLLCETAKEVARKGVPKIISISSIHALDPNNTSAYARSKREASKSLEQIPGLDVTTVYLPSIYGQHWSGKLAVLNKFPKALADFLFRPVSALMPTCNVKRLAEFIHKPDPRFKDRSLIILVEDQDTNIFYICARFFIDWVFALGIIVFFSWLLLLVWVFVKVDSKGPGIFSQTRVGKDGRLFTCYKYRTMAVGTKQTGTHEVSSMAVTKVGSFLRKTKIDELPQVVNILRNELSLIGPRPCLPVQKELIEARRKEGVLDLKPGITGLSQVNNIDMSEPLKLSGHDGKYVQLRGLILDLKIILSTAFGRGQGDKVQENR